MIFFVPGFISYKIWNLLYPSSNKISDDFLSIMAYGCINFIIIFFASYYFCNITMVILVFSLPAVWPLCIKKIREMNWLLKIISVVPPAKAWDFFFSKNPYCFILIHLTNDKMIGGYYNYHSAASTYPRNEDIYIEEVWKIDENGHFIMKIAGTQGMIIKHDSISYLEFFEAKGGGSDE